MKRIGVVSLGLMLGALAVVPGCKKEEGAAPDAGRSTTASATAAAVSASPSASAATVVDTAVASATADVDNLPAPGTQAAAAAKTVTTTNYKTQLDALEKQINSTK
jgi:hypothetical protein